MKLLITGANGQLGKELRTQLANGGSGLGSVPEALKNAEVVAVDIEDADLSCMQSCAQLVKSHRPDVVINCAAYTAVDKAEEQRDAAFAANAIAPRNLAIVCEEIGAKLLHVSTDYVFSCVSDTPLAEDTPTSPQSVYGRTKLLGEEYVRGFCSRWFILRTAWLYGAHGGNFVKTILRLAGEREQLKVVNDQLGNPTNAEDLAHHILQIITTQQYGLYHCTGEGVCSWYDFASEIVRLGEKSAKVNPCASSEYPQAAQRPTYSALDNMMLRATVGNDMRTWQNALGAWFEQMKEMGEKI